VIDSSTASGSRHSVHASADGHLARSDRGEHPAYGVSGNRGCGWGTEAAALDEQIAEKLKRFAQQAELLQSLTRCRRVEAARRD